MANSPVDRNVKLMVEDHGTTHLVTDYNYPMDKDQKFMREIAYDNMNPKLEHFKKQNELHDKIKNDEDYDDWTYGTEPNYGKKPLFG